MSTQTQKAAALSGSELLDAVEERKTTANSLYGRELYEPALLVYLSAIWLLKPPSRPQYPEVLSGQVPPDGADAVDLLGGWRGGVSDAESRESALRLSLHLNVAACALKKTDHYLAREACSQVLERGENAKALFRLAQSLNGLGENRGAIRALSRLLKMEGEQNHKEGRKLLAELKARDAAEKELYRGMSGKEGFGSSEVPSTAPPPDPNKKEEDPQITKLRQMFGGGHMGPPPSSRNDESDSDDEAPAASEARLQQNFEEGEERRNKFYADKTREKGAEERGMSKWLRRFLSGFSLLAALGALALAMLVDESKYVKAAPLEF